MQEENYEERDAQMLSVEDLFLGVQESYSEAQQRAQEENKSFAKTEFFRMDKYGIYRLRILPIAPKTDGTTDRKSYEYPVHQMLLEIEKPGGNSKQNYLYVNVPRATDAGYSLDLIDMYRKMAVSEVKEAGDEKLAEKINGGSFGGGLKFTYAHALYLFDMNERAKGVQLLTLSHSQYKDLDDRKFKLWHKKLAKNPQYPCPISSPFHAYPVEIERKKNGNKTEYLVSIDNESDVDQLTKEELTALMNAPRIPEVIYRYSRYQFEATIEFLNQCDTKYGLHLMETDELKIAIETLRAELPKDDTSTFTFDKRNKDTKENASNGIFLDDLIYRFEELQGKSLGDKTEEGQELRALIRSFIEQEKLSIRVTRQTTNADLLDQIETAIEGNGSGNGSEDTPGEEETTRNRRR